VLSVPSSNAHPVDVLQARLTSLAESQMMEIIDVEVEAMRVKWWSEEQPKMEAKEGRKIWKRGKAP
jgi:hypothetical protein